MKAIFKIALLHIVLGITLSQENREDLIEKLISCYDEHSVTADDKWNFSIGKINATNASENLKCSLKCFMDKLNLFDDAGKFKAEVYKSAFLSLGYLDEYGIVEAVETCKDETGTGPCDTALRIELCIKDIILAKIKAF